MVFSLHSLLKGACVAAPKHTNGDGENLGQLIRHRAAEITEPPHLVVVNYCFHSRWILLCHVSVIGAWVRIAAVHLP